MTGFVPLPDAGHSRTQKFVGKARIMGPKWSHMLTLTIGLLGVQIFWSVEMGYASPYLLSLGLSKSSMAVVFLAGPLSGLIMQPVIGVLADTSTSRFGRRRPYMMAGTTICVLAMLLLGYTRGFAAIFTGWRTPSNDSLTIALAVLSIYLIDFSINAVMAVDRTLLVDTLPPSAQASGNAWAASMLGIGAVVGFFVGSIPLPKMLPFLGTTQLQVLSVIVSILLFAGHSIMAICVKERVLLKETDQDYPTSKRPNAFVRDIRDLWSNILTLPPVIRQICIIQFFAWIAWFPILFYTTIYVGDLYKRATPLAQSPLPTTPDMTLAQARDAEATRLGTRSLFYSSLLALIINLVLPAFVATPVSRSKGRTRTPRPGAASEDQGWLRIPERMKVNLASLWAVSHLVLAGCMLATLFTESVGGATILVTITGFSWAVTQWAPFSLLAEAILTTPDPSSAQVASIRLADTRTPIRDDDHEQETFLPSESSEHHRRSHEHDSGDELNSGGDGHISAHPATANNIMLGNPEARVSRLHVDVEGDAAGDAEWEDDDDFSRVRRDGEEGAEGEAAAAGGLSGKAGIILGIHNVFIVVPQFLITGLSAIAFAIFDPIQARPPIMHPSPPPPPVPSADSAARRMAHGVMREVAGFVVRDLAKDAAEQAERDERGGQSNSVVYIFRLGGVAALIAFILAWRLAKQLRHR
ncbi:General alpha-glucoside permease [Hypsizygus marmoreus]|uniref:General alpha-glucoside permease n=1 Tax=Hypsizygus marmoreus TaxID=39966 RepID=A0A369K413_HYPMA|nr:General alpha-glucoside permease [Hypsizygus marmoreus]